MVAMNQIDRSFGTTSDWQLLSLLRFLILSVDQSLLESMNRMCLSVHHRLLHLPRLARKEHYLGMLGM